MTHAIAAAELPGVLARLSMREDEEACERKIYAILKELGPVWFPVKLSRA